MPDTAPRPKRSPVRVALTRLVLGLALAGLLFAPSCGRDDGTDGGKAAASSGRQARRGGPGGRPGGSGPWGRRGGAKAPAQRIPVVVTEAGRSTMEAFLDASATLEAEQTVEVVSQATGVVVEVLAEEGDAVREGQVLARLAYEELELAEQRARNQLDKLRADFERSQRLARENLISEDDFSQVRFDLNQAEIDWRQKNLELERTRIVSPIRGTVVERMIRKGELKRENEAVYRLVDFDSLIAPVYVPEKYLSDLHVGQQALMRTPALGDRLVKGSVLRISPVVDGQSGTIRVVIQPARGAGLRPGMFGNVQLVLDSHEDVIVIPKKAIVYDDERPRVFVVERGQAAQREIELGYQDETRAEVVSGIEEGELVVIVGQSALKDGSAVKAEDEQGRPVGRPEPGEGEAAGDEEQDPAADGSATGGGGPRGSDGEPPAGGAEQGAAGGPSSARGDGRRGPGRRPRAADERKGADSERTTGRRGPRAEGGTRNPAGKKPSPAAGEPADGGSGS